MPVKSWELPISPQTSRKRRRRVGGFKRSLNFYVKLLGRTRRGSPPAARGPNAESLPVPMADFGTYCSDKGASGERADESGEAIVRLLHEAGHDVMRKAVVADDRALIAERLRVWADDGLCDVILTTGGTGLTGRDVTPEATRDIAERDVPGLVYALVTNGLRYTPHAALTRGLAVTRGRVLIVNLPGSPKAVTQGMDVLLPLLSHVAELLAGPVEHTREQP